MGGHGNTAAVVPTYTALQVQTSSSAVPVPILWGINVLAPNIVWTEGFTATPQYSQSSGGKGGGNSSTVSGYTYSLAIIMGLCEGPINTVGTIWKGQSTYSLETMNPPSISVPNYLETGNFKVASVSLFNGTTPQAAWGYLPSSYPSQALNYPGLAYIAAPSYQLGSSGTLDVTYVEVYGILYTSGVVNAHDADPALVVQDFLTNAQYGVGFPSASIDATTLLGSSGGSSYQAYCQAAGLALSPALTDQEAANSILARWLQLTNTAAVWSDGKLKFIPYGDSSITGELYGGTGSVTFNPDLTPVYNLTDDDFIYTDGDDPVQVMRTDPYAAYNMQPVEILDRSNSYAATPITAFDQNAIDLYGLVLASTVTAHEICDSAIALTAAQLILQRGLYIRNTYTFKLSWEYCLLEPMDLVTITDAGLGLFNAAIRITEIDEDDSGILTVTAEEFPAGTATAVAYPVQTPSGGSFNRNVAPDPVNPPMIVEPPAALTTNGEAEVWIGLSGGASGTADPNWGGAAIWISKDNATFTAIGTVTSPARQGVLTAALPSAAGQSETVAPFAITDTSNTLALNMAESGGVLSSATAGDAENGVTLCLVDQELLTYTTATLTGSSAYALTGLARGVYGSEPASHSIGAPLTRIDNAIFKYALPAIYVGVELYLKFQSFNVFGNAVQSLADCAVYTYTPVGSGALGPLAAALAVGNNADCGLASASASEYDDFGIASDPYPNFIDLGLASS